MTCFRLRAYSRSIAIGTLCASIGTMPVAAQTPVISLSDLVNQGSDYAERELPRRGYVLTHADPRGSKLWEFWWQGRDGVCARVAHVDGRATSIVNVNPTECNQHPSADDRASGKLSDGAKVAIGAAALLGVAALVHRSHERDERQHGNQQQVAEYERGYRDGLYHQPYHDYNRSQAYVDGFNAGQQKRDAETRYRSPYGQHSGQTAYVWLNDLVGARGSSADDTLRQRGFVDKGGYKSNNQTFSTWWNARTRQCMQVVVGDGRVRSINAMVEGNCL